METTFKDEMALIQDSITWTTKENITIRGKSNDDRACL